MIRQNVRAQRARLRLTQAQVAQRMNQLGYGWYAQTTGLVERNQRPLLADELAALALALETTPDVLMLPPGDVAQVAFGEHQVPAQRLSVIDDSVSWDGNDLKVIPPAEVYRPGDLRAAIHAVREQARRVEAGESAPQPEDQDAEDIEVRRPEQDGEHDQ